MAPYDSVGCEVESKTVTQPWRKVLLDAADYIEKHGWCQGGNGRKGAARCVGVAQMEAAGFGAPVCIESYEKLVAYLGIKSGRLPEWNDAPERTASEVIAALRACALSPDTSET